MSKNKISIIDGVRYHSDRPSSCRACYFWKNSWNRVGSSRDSSSNR